MLNDEIEKKKNMNLTKGKKKLNKLGQIFYTWVNLKIRNP